MLSALVLLCIIKICCRKYNRKPFHYDDEQVFANMYRVNNGTVFDSNIIENLCFAKCMTKRKKTKIWRFYVKTYVKKV